jgi:hypothetical protein
MMLEVIQIRHNWKGSERMEEMLNVLRKKSQIKYDMNCIEQYIKDGDCDKSLKHAWNGYRDNLIEIEEELKLLSNPETKVLEEKKLELLHKIEEHNREILMIKHQIKGVEKKLMTYI